jgi:arginine utilization protein RocB
MFSNLQFLETARQAEYLTRELIKLKSYNGTNGENLKAQYLLDVIHSFPYFQQNRKHAWTKPIEHDELQRKNVFALVKAANGTKKTIIFHAHIDTVGTEDFGSLQAISHDPDALQAYFAGYSADQDVQQDALSGEWLFGRGSLDMQSGIAVHLVNLLYFSRHPEELNGNLLVMFNPDEESQHAGMRSALTELKRLREEYSLEFTAAINDDFITPLYEGDENKYIYTGVAGKLLPCFYIFGRETHVGESVSTIDPTIIASALNLKIAQNFQFVEKIEGELVLPPSCLFLRDDKKSYDVQTAISSKLYFNYFVYEKSPRQVINELLGITKQICTEQTERQKNTYLQFCHVNVLPAKQLDWTIEVTSLENYIHYLTELNLHPEETIQETYKKYKREDYDDRMLAFYIVEALQNLDPEKKPRVIVFFAPPFLPSNYMEEDNLIYSKVQAELEKEALLVNERFQLKKYFPYLSDGSFMTFNGAEAEMISLKNNFPAMDQLFPLPLEAMKELSIPSINIGVYGKNGHNWTERVYKPYSFGVLPKLIRNVTISLLAD